MAKEKKSSSKDKKKSSSSKSKTDGGSSKDTTSKLLGSTSDAFEYGRLFATYCRDKNVGLTHDEFITMMKDMKIQGGIAALVNPLGTNDSKREFDAGVLFAKYDVNHQGVIDSDSFRRILQEVTNENISNKYRDSSSSTNKHVDFGCGSARVEYKPSYYSEWKLDPREKIHYTSPLPHLINRSGMIDDPETAILRKDYLHLQNLLEAILAPRIENEVRVLERLEELKEIIRKEEGKIIQETEVEVKKILDRLKLKTLRKCQAVDRIGSAHRKCLEKMSQFQFLAASPRPRDALRLHSIPASQFAVLEQAKHSGYTLEPSSDPTLEFYQRQREKAQAAFENQGQTPHPVVMRDFVEMFIDFQAAAQKLADAPYKHMHDEQVDIDENPIERAERVLSSDPLPREVTQGQVIITKLETLENQIELKDKMIWKLVQEREALQKLQHETSQQLEELADASHCEIKEWEQLYNRLKQEMKAKHADSS